MIFWAWPNRAAGERAYGVEGRRGRHPRPANSSPARARLQQVEEPSSAPCCGSVAMLLCAVVPCCRRIQRFRVCQSVVVGSNVVTWSNRRRPECSAFALHPRVPAQILAFAAQHHGGPISTRGHVLFSVPEAGKSSSTSILRLAMQTASGTCPREAPSALEIAAAFKEKTASRPTFAFSKAI